jgi:hypothetical protein
VSKGAQPHADFVKLRAALYWNCAVPVGEIGGLLGWEPIESAWFRERNQLRIRSLIEGGLRIVRLHPEYAQQLLLDGPPSRPANPPGPRNAAIVAARESGRTLKDIAREHGITQERVRQVVARYGAPPDG